MSDSGPQMTPPLPPRHPPTDAEQVVQHLVVVQAERGTPLTVGQCEILRQQLEVLYMVNYPRHLIASHAGALLRCFAACTTMGAPALSPAPAPAPASAAAAAAAQVCDPEFFEDAQEQCSMDDSMDGSMDSSSPPPRLRLTDLPNEILGFIYSFLSSDNRRNFFILCKEIHSCSAIRSQVHRLKLPADAAASAILSFPKGCTLKALELDCGSCIHARLLSLISLKASNILSSVEELKFVVPEPQDLPFLLSPTVEGLSHLFPSLCKISFRAQMWSPALQVILKSLTEGLAPGQLRELVFQYYNEFSGNVGFCGADLASIPHPGDLISLGIGLEPARLNPQAAQPIMQLTQLERLHLANANSKEFLEYVPYALQLLASLPRLNFLQMIKLPTGLMLNMPSLKTLHFRSLHIEELHELQHCLLRSSMPNLHRVALDNLLTSDNLADFSADACKLSPGLLKGYPLDLSATTLILGAYFGALDAERVCHVVSSLVSMGSPFTEIKSLRLLNRVADRSPVPLTLMSDLARLLAGVTKIDLVGYWSNQGLGPCKAAILEFEVLTELRLEIPPKYHDRAHKTFGCIIHKLDYFCRLLPLDLLLCPRDIDPSGLIEEENKELESEGESDMSLSFMETGYTSEDVSGCDEP